MPTNEETKNQDTSPEEATEDTDTETVDATVETEEDDSPSTEETTDFKALFEQERERREKAERAKAEKAFKDRAKKREEEPEETVSEDEDDKPLTKKDIFKLLQREREEARKEFQSTKIREIVSSLASNDDEAQLIIEIHKNRIFPEDLSLEEQLEEAHAIANRKRIVGKNHELARALKGKEGAVKQAPSAQRDTPTGSQPKLDAQLLASYKRAGLTYDNKLKVWKKKLPNGSWVMKDPRTKQFVPIKG